MTRHVLASLTALAATCAVLPSAAAQGLLRFPDVHKDRVVFTHGGDLWTASVAGGVARRITAHPGIELFGKFSPDGKSIAFTGQYDGDEQVYVMPAEGGPPRQLTFYPARGPLPARWGFDHQVYDFTPDGTQVLFRGLREHWTLGEGRLYTVPVKGGMPVALAPPVAGAGALSPDGKRLVYSPLFRDFRTWKRYQGGWAQELYIYDLDKAAVQQITDSPRADRDPMWGKDAIYFASDRDGRMNLYRYDLTSKATTQLTHHTQADLRWPSMGPDGAIVYELEGRLHLFQTATGEDRTLEITIPDDGLASRPRDVDVSSAIEGFELGPNGKRALVVARGDVFDVPTEHGLTRNLTHSSNAHERDATWSPDGKSVVFISDVLGEEELWLYERAAGTFRQLTFKSQGRLYGPRWSPDARRLAYSDKAGRLFVVEVEGRKKTEVSKDPYGYVDGFAWSPRGGHLAFTRSSPNGGQSVHVYSVEDGKTHAVTDPTFNAYAPTWDTKGDYLFYLSDRDFRPQLGSFDFNFVGNLETGVFGVALRRDVKDLFAPKDDEVVAKADEGKGPAKDPKAKGKGDGKGDDKEATGVEAIRKQGFEKIEFEGLGSRVTRVPMPTSNYGGLDVTPTHVVALDRGPPFLGRDDIEPKLVTFALEDEKLQTLASGVQGYSLSGDRQSVLVRTKAGLQVLSVKKGGPSDKPKPLPTKGLVARVDPKAEWMEIFDEVWRRYRDYFYVENMHGHDWAAIRERYRPLVAQVAHREELNDVLGQMVAELEVSHAYVAGGDLGLPPRPGVALLGARFELDARAGRYRIREIMQGQNEEPLYRAPLTEVGVDARVGDYVLEINGEALLAEDNPYHLLRGSLAEPVELLLNATPDPKGARRVMVKPIASEQPLVYLAMITRNMARVSAATDGKMGYLHIPDMGENGLREFVKWFFPQVRKEGLIIDVRANGGGFVSQLIIERLRRKLIHTSFGRDVNETWTYPQNVMVGPMVCLIDETSASDGDIFPDSFRAAGIGPLIGKRTWGGVIGINGHGPVIDGGDVFVPQYSTNGPDGAYIIEGYGVAPDIEVENDPVKVAAGGDPQLERAIQEVVSRRARIKGPLLPKRPADPVKNNTPK
ncbi:MAG: PD40 domain-containing protein [Deltaproteobacteria bacterium]|nr:PD40 domain-containing protein [Deltaproteobacteria bacterium]